MEEKEKNQPAHFKSVVATEVVLPEETNEPVIKKADQPSVAPVHQPMTAQQGAQKAAHMAEPDTMTKDHQPTETVKEPQEQINMAAKPETLPVTAKISVVFL